MRLTQYTDFGLRLLMYLAGHPDETVTIGRVSAAFGISGNHLAVIAKRMVTDGLLVAKRGRNGGVRLAHEPAALSLGKLVLQLEHTANLVECFDPHGDRCPITSGCRLRTVLFEAREAFFAALDRYTLADVVHNRSQLVELLGTSTARHRELLAMQNAS